MLQRIKCWMGKHQYYVLQEYSYTTRKLGCRCCKGEWGMNDDVRCIIPWDHELETLHAEIRSVPGYGR